MKVPTDFMFQQDPDGVITWLLSQPGRTGHQDKVSPLRALFYCCLWQHRINIKERT